MALPCFPDSFLREPTAERGGAARFWTWNGCGRASVGLRIGTRKRDRFSVIELFCDHGRFNGEAAATCGREIQERQRLMVTTEAVAFLGVICRALFDAPQSPRDRRSDRLGSRVGRECRRGSRQDREKGKNASHRGLPRMFAPLLTQRNRRSTRRTLPIGGPRRGRRDSLSIESSNG